MMLPTSSCSRIIVVNPSTLGPPVPSVYRPQDAYRGGERPSTVTKCRAIVEKEEAVVPVHQS